MIKPLIVRLINEQECQQESFEWFNFPTANQKRQ